MRHIAIATILTLTTACHDCPPSDDASDDSSSAVSSSEESSSSEGSSDGSSSGGEPAVPYGPCEENEDCPIFPGDGGLVSPEARCFQGTCSYYCGYIRNSNVVACPGYIEYTTIDPPYFPFSCEDSWCSVNGPTERMGGAPCPPGMYQGDPRAMPGLGCVWQEPAD